MLSNNKNKEVIDAGIEIEHRKQSDIEGERGDWNIGLNHRQLPVGAKTFLLIISVCAFAIGGVFIWKAWRVHNAVQDNSKYINNNLVRNILPSLVPSAPIHTEEQEFEKVPAPEILPIISAPQPDLHEDQPASQSPAEALQRRRLSGDLIDATGKTSQTSNQSAIGKLEHDRINDSENELQSKLQPLRLNPSAAGMSGDPDYLLTQGAMIDCQLETRMITTQPGMTSCYTTRNIYSTNGRVILIDRGSKIVGNYQGGMQQGQARIFVLWSRIETPKGVVINIDSPGSGPLGEGGADGTIDTHFWQRFGGAIMISLIGDFGQYAANKGRSNKNANSTINFTGTTQGMQQAATEALKNSINIPPTLYKNQGERISIFVARDLDFRGVYGFE